MKCISTRLTLLRMSGSCVLHVQGNCIIPGYCGVVLAARASLQHLCPKPVPHRAILSSAGYLQQSPESMSNT